MVEQYEELLEELECEENDLIYRIDIAQKQGDKARAEDLEDRLAEVMIQMDAIEEAISACMSEPLDFSEDDDTESID